MGGGRASPGRLSSAARLVGGHVEDGAEADSVRLGRSASRGCEVDRVRALAVSGRGPLVSVVSGGRVGGRGRCGEWRSVRERHGNAW